MRATILAAGGLVAAAAYANAQTFTACNPLQKTCPCDPALASTITTDFTKGASSDWEYADGTSMTYDGTNGAQFTIATKTDAPTIALKDYIFFGKVSVVTRASPGTGTVSSFILESDDLDEIDWEWLGSTDSSVESNFFGKGNTTTYDRAIYHPVGTPSETFHEYTIDWTSSYIKWSIDGAVVRTLNYGDALALEGKNFPQTPMKVKMGSWIGCLDAAAAANPATQGTCQWAGGYIDLTKGPYVMSVKSVTVQDYGTGSQYCYSDNSGSFESITSVGGSPNKVSSSSQAPTSGTTLTTATTSTPTSTSASTPSSGSSTDSGTPGTVASSSTASAKSSTSTVASSTSTTTSGSGASKSTPTSGSSSTDSGTTLTTTTTAATASGTVKAASTTSTAQTTSSDASILKPKHKYGFVDIGVMGLGLFLGYLVM